MWYTIKNYEKYEINEKGEIRNKKSKRLLKAEVCKGDYLRVRLYIDSKNTKHELVHRLVAFTFLPNPNNFPEVNHKDNNPKNNEVVNLEWCTPQYNSRYSKSKPVIMCCLGGRGHSKSFTCITEAYLQTGIDKSSIIRCCKGVQKQAGGYVWKYNKKEVEL